MAAVVFINMVGASWSVLFYDGSALAKNVEKRVWLEAVEDRAIEAAMEAELYGETTASEEFSTHDPKAAIELIRETDKISAMFCILLTAILPFLIRRYRQMAWLYLLPAAWLLLNAHAVALNGGKAYAHLAIPAHATRWMLPIALCLLNVMKGCIKPKPHWILHTNWMLRIACASTFVIHGWEAFQLHPGFQDLIYVTWGYIGPEPSADTIHILLRVIGLMDGMMAMSVLLVHSPKTLYWMALWGLITALSRPLTMGFEAWPELAMRLANAAVPMFIIALGLPALIRLHQKI